MTVRSEVRSPRNATIAFALVAVAVGTVMAGCGGTSRSTTSTSASSPVATVTSDPSPQAAPSPAGKPAAPSAPSESAAQATRHGASGFRVQGGENSVPNFGKEAHASEKQRAVATLEAFMKARAKGEWATVCDDLSRATRHPLEVIAMHSNGKLPGCGPVLAELLKQQGAAAEQRTDTLTNGVAALRIDGVSAFALYYGPGADKYVMPMQNEAGTWKMTQLAPLRYPLGTSAVSP
jgi:hypothetical protein